MTAGRVVAFIGGVMGLAACTAAPPDAGAREALVFHPLYCFKSCDLAAGVAARSHMTFDVDPVDGSELSRDLEPIASDRPVCDGARWLISTDGTAPIGLSSGEPGWCAVVVWDTGTGEEIDWVGFPVRAADRLALRSEDPTVVAATAPGFDEVWTARAGQGLDLVIDQRAGDVRLLGVAGYAIDDPDAILVPRLGPFDEDLAVIPEAPPGSHAITVRKPGDVLPPLRVRIDITP